MKILSKEQVSNIKLARGLRGINEEVSKALENLEIGAGIEFKYSEWKRKTRPQAVVGYLNHYNKKNGSKNRYSFAGKEKDNTAFLIIRVE